MALETELKAWAVDLARTRDQLRDLGATLVAPRTFEDNWLLDRPEQPLRNTGEVLRVRHYGERMLLTWKGRELVADGIRTREELEVNCEAGTDLAELLERLGFRTTFRYQKYREVWRLEGTSVMLDETPIGDFIEVEGESRPVRAVAQQLGIAPEAMVVHGYATIFRRWLTERDRPDDAMLFDA